MSALMFVVPETARVFRVREGRRFLTKDAAYLGAARMRAHVLADTGISQPDHDGVGREADCVCRVCRWRSANEDAGGSWHEPPPELLRYARKMAAHDRVIAAELAGELFPSVACQRAIDAVKAAHLAVTALGPDDRRRFDREIERWSKAERASALKTTEVA